MSHNYSTEYDLARNVIGGGGFATSEDKLVARIKALMGVDGFDSNASDALDMLRAQIGLGNRIGGLITGKSDGEAGRMLSAANGYGAATGGKGAPTFKGDADVVARVAALKLLRHTDLISKSGARSVWISAAPKEYRDWPSEELRPLAGKERELRDRVGKVRDYYGFFQKRHISEGAQFALAWVQKTLIKLGNANQPASDTKALIRRWFETKDTTAKDIDGMVGELTDGFKKIQAALNSNRLIFTDYPKDRGTDDEQGTEAFVFNAGWTDRLGVVYIEQGFFARGANVLSGRDNWARIIVHELSHKELGTDDYPADNSYAWQGINPQDAKFAGNMAITNAENWAYFAADCANALSTGERATALQKP